MLEDFQPCVFVLGPIALFIRYRCVFVLGEALSSRLRREMSGNRSPFCPLCLFVPSAKEHPHGVVRAPVRTVHPFSVTPLIGERNDNRNVPLQSVWDRSEIGKTRA
jgi:hypothetical protein